MKAIITLLFFLSALLTFAQRPVELEPTGGGEYYFEKTTCLKPEDYESINARLTASLAQLRADGRLPEVSDRNIVSFGWPLQADPSLTFYSYYGITNYVDQNTTSALLDYNCGTRTYDGHWGTDIATWPFPWYLVNNDLVQVIAAAPGTIILKDDGNADNHCSCSGNWNAIYVQHADGSIAWYGHMKNGSLTSKTVGQAVSQGEFLGIVASSGCSTGPHLHLEVYKATPYQRSNLIDPYQGTCNSLNSVSWWAAQQPNEVPTLNAIATHNAPPVMNCPSANEVPNFSNTLNAGTTRYFGTYYRDQQLNHVTTFRLLRPNGSVQQTWTHTAPATYSLSWWYFGRNIPSAGPNGVWTYEVTYQGQTFTHNFTVVGAFPVEMTHFEANKIDKNTISLNWETATERNNHFFDIERSGDARIFNSIGQVKGNGTSNEAHQYQFLDKNPLSGTNYYRLRQVDYDDRTDYSEVVSVQMTASQFVLSPNPTTGLVSVAGPIEKIEKIRVFDSKGKLVQVVTGALPTSSINLSKHSSGVYFVEITHSAHVEQCKIIKQ